MKQPSSAELTLRERALIDEARALVSPSAADAARVKGKLWATLKLGETAAAGGEPSIPKSPGLALKQRVGLLTVGFGIGLAAGYGLERQVDRPSPPPTSMPSAPVIQPPHEDQGQAVAGRASSPAPTATPATPVIESAGSDTRPPQHSDAGTQRVGASPTPQTSNTPIDEIDEVEWVQRVQRALAKGEPQLALGLLRHLDEALPNGRLLEERRAAEVIAQCQTSPERGRARAAAFVQDFARSVHLARIRAACELKSRDE